jgi:cytochrome bd-type quinol oxidase subunit 2
MQRIRYPNAPGKPKTRQLYTGSPRGYTNVIQKAHNVPINAMKQSKTNLHLAMVRVSLIASMGGPLILILAAAVLEALQPNYNPIRQTVSALAIGPFGLFQTIAFIIFAFLLGVFIWRLYDSVSDKGPALKIATALLILVAAGFLIIGIFPTQAEGLPESWQSVIHHRTARTISVLFPIACLLLASSFKNDPHFKRIFIYTVVMALIALALIVLGPIKALNSQWVGLYERIYLLNGLIWIEVVSFRLLTAWRNSRKTAAG